MFGLRRWAFVACAATAIAIAGAIANRAPSFASSSSGNVQTLTFQRQSPLAGPQVTLREAIALAREAVNDPARAVFGVMSAPNSPEAGAQGRAAVWMVTLASGEDREATVQIDGGTVVRIQVVARMATRLPVDATIDSPQALVLAKGQGLQPGSGKGPGYAYLLRSINGRASLGIVGAAGASPARIEIDAESGGLLSRERYLLDNSGGVLVSDDAGVTWRASDLRGPVFAVNADAQGAQAVRESADGLTLWTTSDGHAWIRVSDLPASPGAHAYSIARLDNGAVLVGTTEGVLRSQNSGQSWTAELSGPVQYLAALRGGRAAASVSAGAGVGLYTSESTGRWSAAGAASRLVQLAAGQAAIVDDRTLMARVIDGTPGSVRLGVPKRALRLARAGTDWLAATPEGVLRSSDAGLTWSATLVANNASLFVASDGWSGGLALAGGFRSPTYRSIDGGRTWIVALRNAADVIPGGNEVIYIGALGAGSLIAVEGGAQSWQPY